MKVELVTLPAQYPITLTEAKKQCEIDTSDTTHDTYVKSLIVAATGQAEQYLHRRLVSQTWKLYLDEWPFGSIIKLPFGQLQYVKSIKYKDENGTESTFGTVLPTITGITKASTGVVSCAAHGLSLYDKVHFYDLSEMTELNNTTQVVTVIDSANSFSINDCSGYADAETTGGITATQIDYLVDTQTEPGQIVLDYLESWPTDELYPSNPIKIEFVCGYYIGDTWVKETVYAENDLVIPVTENGLVYKCTTGLTSSATAPTWPLTIGGTVADGAGLTEGVWTCIGLAIPEAIKHAIKLTISDLFENRETETYLPNHFKLETWEAMLFPYKLFGGVF